MSAESVASHKVTLPQAVVTEIFSYAYGSEVLRYAPVCRTWQRASAENRLWYTELGRSIKRIKHAHVLSRYDSRFEYKKVMMLFHIKKFPFYPGTLTLLKGAYSEIYDDKEMSTPLKVLAILAHALIVTPITIAISPIAAAVDSSEHGKHEATPKGTFCVCQSCYHQERALRKAVDPVFLELATVFARRPDEPKVEIVGPA